MKLPVGLRNYLSVSTGCDTGFSWFLRDEDWRPVAERIAAHFSSKDFSFEQLKIGDKRDIFRCPSNPPVPSCVAKTYPMSSLKQRLWRYRRYGPREAANLLEAQSRGVPAPELYGFGWRQRGPLVERTMIIMEDLADYSPIGKIVVMGTEFQDLVLESVGKMLLRFHQSGCNHIDLSTENILFSNEDPRVVRAIDFMYVAFLPAPSMRVLAFQTAYVVQGLLSSGLPELRCRNWVEQFFETNGQVPVGDLRSSYHDFLGRKMSRKERLTL